MASDRTAGPRDRPRPVSDMMARLAAAMDAQRAAGGPPPPPPPESRRDALRASWEALVPARFHAATLSTLPAVRWAATVIDWSTRRPAPNLILHGPPGTGKTWTAAAALRRRYADGDRITWWSTAALLDTLRPGRDDDGTAWTAALTADILLLDDLAAQRDTDWTDERLDLLVDDRWSQLRPIVVTTNLTPGEAAIRLPARLQSRLYGDAITITITGDDRRAQC